MEQTTKPVDAIDIQVGDVVVCYPEFGGFAYGLPNTARVTATRLGDWEAGEDEVYITLDIGDIVGCDSLEVIDKVL